MTSQGNGSPFIFQVRLIPKTVAEFKEFHREAALTGRGAMYIAALRRIRERLRSDPRNFGEALYHLPARNC